MYGVILCTRCDEFEGIVHLHIAKTAFVPLESWQLLALALLASLERHKESERHENAISIICLSFLLPDFKPLSFGRCWSSLMKHHWMSHPCRRSEIKSGLLPFWGECRADWHSAAQAIDFDSKTAPFWRMPSGDTDGSKIQGVMCHPVYHT